MNNENKQKICSLKELEEAKVHKEAKEEAITVRHQITVPIARNEFEIPIEEPTVPTTEEVRGPQEDQQKLVELVGAQTSELVI